MQELLLAVARGLVEDKEAVQVTVDPMREDGTVVYHLKVAEADMGRVIGKQGRIAKAIRVVVRAAAVLTHGINSHLHGLLVFDKAAGNG